MPEPKERQLDFKTYEDGVRDGFAKAQEMYTSKLMKLATSREVRIYALQADQVATFVNNHTCASDEVIVTKCYNP